MTDLVVTLDPNVAQNEVVVQFLSTNGDGSGSVNAIGDYSSSPVDFYIRPSGEVYKLSRLIVSITDKKGFEHDGYGDSSSSALTRGIDIVLRGDVLRNIKTNCDWVSLIGTANVFNWGTDDQLVASLELAPAFGQFVRLRDGEAFGLRLNDNFDHLDDHRFTVKGYRENTPL